jgi:hypothetical protein
VTRAGHRRVGPTKARHRPIDHGLGWVGASTPLQPTWIWECMCVAHTGSGRSPDQHAIVVVVKVHEEQTCHPAAVHVLPPSQKKSPYGNHASQIFSTLTSFVKNT